MAVTEAADRAPCPTSLRQAVSEVSLQFWAATNVGGLSQAHGAPLRPLRLLWLGLFAVGVTLTAVDVQRVVVDYLSRPHDTLLDVVHESALPFPAVTVCSQSQLDCLQLTRRSLQEEGGEHADLLRTVLRESQCLDPGGTRCLYLWNALSGLATAQWISDMRPFCMLCGQCRGLQSQIQRSGDLDRYRALYEEMGCNSTCLQNNATLGAVQGGDGEPIDPVTPSQENNSGGPMVSTGLETDLDFVSSTSTPDITEAMTAEGITSLGCDGCLRNSPNLTVVLISSQNIVPIFSISLLKITDYDLVKSGEAFPCF